MSQELIKQEISTEAKAIWEDALLVISTSSISSAQEIADMLQVTESIVLELLNNDEFYNTICSHSIASMRLAYHSIGIPELVKRLNGDDFYNSYDRLTKAIGAVKEKDHEGMKMSLEVLLKNEKDITPRVKINKEKTSGNIFDIEDNSKPVSPHKQELEFEFEEEE